MGSSDGNNIAMQGMMMKKKSKSGLFGTKWVMRYFVLYDDGKLVYFQEKPEGGVDGSSGQKREVLCDNIGECALDVVNASDLAGRDDAVANSFYITGKGRSKGTEQRTLLVTNGPVDFKRWILAFRKMKVEMLHGVGSAVKDKEKRNDSITQTKEGNEEIVPVQISFNNSDEVNAGETADDPQSTPPFEKGTSVRFAAEDEAIIREPRDDANEEETKSVTFSDKDAEVIREAVSGSDDKSVTFSDKDAQIVFETDDLISGDDKSVTFSDRDDIIDDKSVTFSDKDSEIIPEAVFSGDDSENGVKWKDEVAESIDETEIASSSADDVEEAVAKDITKEEVKEDTAAKEEEEARVKAEEERKEEAAKRAAANKARREQEMKRYAEKIKVFAYGDLYDDMTEALDDSKVLFGIITTSVEEMLDDEAYLNVVAKEHHSELTPISIQYSGPKAHYSEVNNYKNHLHEIGSFCKTFCKVDRLNPIVYGNKIETRNRILTLLGEAHQDEVFPEVVAPDSPRSNFAKKAEKYRSMRVVDTGNQTAYKHALDIQGVDGVPNGPDLLKIVREPLGAPYNWVLFKPSKDELIVEDGGSGGVMELAKVVHRDYNDKVLYGLARVSFAGDFGLRQFWCALEWKGENASGIKALKSYRETLAPMAELIGDRSFTLSNSAAMDLSPQIVVDFVKKSCNVEFLSVTLEALKSAHEMEQKAIEEYWSKLEAKDKARKDARDAERLKKEEEERDSRLKIRASKLAKTKAPRAARKEKWSTMNAPELLEDLGKDDISGWVLLQVNLEK